LTTDEKHRFLEVAADEAGSDISIGFSLTGHTLEEDIELLERAQQVGCSHGLLSFPQDFRPDDQDEVFEHVAALSESTDLGIYLFISDKFGLHHLHPSGVPFDAYDRAMELPNIVGMKVGGMDLGMVTEVFERYGEQVAVAAINFGLLPLLVDHYDQQWSGAWTIEALQSPDKPHVVDLFELLRAGRLDEAMDLYWRLTPAMGVMMQLMAPLIPAGVYHWPQLKYYQFCTGGNGGVTRQPSMRLSKRAMDQIKGGFRAIGIDADPKDDVFFVGRTFADRVTDAASA
jgi:4-hydroxy-tetrahydrodipicolinate synthase